MTIQLPIITDMPAEHRACDGCIACCYAVGVREIHKPRHTLCPHLTLGPTFTGCSIYQQRPKSCADYACEWLLGRTALEHKPDKCGVVLSRMFQPLAQRTLLTISEYIPGALEEFTKTPAFAEMARKELIMALTPKTLNLFGPDVEEIKKVKYWIQKRAQQLENKALPASQAKAIATLRKDL